MFVAKTAIEKGLVWLYMTMLVLLSGLMAGWLAMRIYINVFGD